MANGKRGSFPNLKDLGLDGQLKTVRGAGRDGSFITLPGQLKYAFLTKARDYKGDGNFAYSTQFILPAGSVEQGELTRLLEAIYKLGAAEARARKEKVSSTFKAFSQVDDETGDQVYRFKLKRDIVDFGSKKVTGHRSVRFVDAKGAPIPAEKRPNIGTGTIAKLAFTPSFYSTPLMSGVSLKVTSVQILNLVRYEGRSDHFEAAEGYVYSEEGYEGETDAAGGEAFTRPSVGGSGSEEESF